MAVNLKSKFDFSGWATKIGLKCSDGRTILKDAFKHNDGQKVPLVWQHLHNEPSNILGHAILENREEGVYAYCKFNESVSGQNAKELVVHGDITMLSIFANSLKQKGSDVVHGMIREVSLVLSGANPEALIENLYFAHGDGLEPSIDESEAVIYTGLTVNIDSVQHAEEDDHSKEESKNKKEAESKEELKHATYSEDATVQDVFDTLDETQKTVVYAMVAQALSDDDIEHSNIEGESAMKTNVFDKSTDNSKELTLFHDNFSAIMTDAKRCGSLKDAVMAHAAEYGIENIDILFPDARLVRNTPDMIKRDDTWVSGFLAGVYKTPFSRIKSMAADLTADEARAKGYITGSRKIEEVFPVLKRTTTPTTIYKKQKLDRDDVTDITDFDVVAWLKGEMRLMLDEELARAALIGDGRPVEAEDHINTQNIRPIWTDDPIYAPKVKLPGDITTLDLVDAIVRARRLYKGSSVPNLYTTEEVITDMLLIRDTLGRRIYPTMADLSSALRVNQLISVEVMEDQTRTLPDTSEVVSLVGILVNPRDYTMGADKGGQVGMFEDFDIDYNQHKYLIETRVSGALTRPKSAVVIEKGATVAEG